MTTPRLGYIKEWTPNGMKAIDFGVVDNYAASKCMRWDGKGEVIVSLYDVAHVYNRYGGNLVGRCFVLEEYYLQVVEFDPSRPTLLCRKAGGWSVAYIAVARIRRCAADVKSRLLATARIWGIR